MIKIVDIDLSHIHPEWKEIFLTTLNGYCPERCLYCNERMIMPMGDDTYCCMNCLHWYGTSKKNKEQEDTAV
jgi:hypothetical protein